MNLERAPRRTGARPAPSRVGITLNIGQAAAATGLSAKMIRHYESLGLIGPPRRNDAGYRRYDEESLRTLRFVGHARELGFSLETIGQLVSLWKDPTRASADVKRIALGHVADLDRRIAMLSRMRDAIAATAEHCQGDDRATCPILEDLARG
jgi:MerR family copper efflux transcriptional regulator